MTSAECALDAPPMHAQPKLLLESLRQLGGVEGRVDLQCRFELAHDLIGELVCSLRPRTLRDQPRQAFGLEGGLRLIERRSREAEIGGGLADGGAILAYAAQGYVSALPC